MSIVYPVTRARETNSRLRARLVRYTIRMIIRRRTPTLEVTLDADLTNRRVPIWVLDIDGVVNALAPNAALSRIATNEPGMPAMTATADVPQIVGAWPEYVPMSCEAPYGDEEAPLNIAAGLVDRITALHNERLVEIIWASAWSEHAVVFGEAVGLPVFPAHYIQQSFDLGSFIFKAKVVAAAVATGRSVIWTDDQYATKQDFAEVVLPQRFLAVRPDSRWGLLPADMDRIETFIRSAVNAGAHVAPHVNTLDTEPADDVGPQFVGTF